MSNTAKQIEQFVAGATTRRGFLGRLARTAGTAAAAMAGVLATRSAGAGAGNGKGPKARLCCEYAVDWGYYERHCTQRKSCPKEWFGGTLIGQWEINNCDACF